MENVVGELVVDLQGNPMINDLALFETELEGVSSTDEESGNIKQEISNIIFETDNVRDGV